MIIVEIVENLKSILKLYIYNIKIVVKKCIIKIIITEGELFDKSRSGHSRD